MNGDAKEIYDRIGTLETQMEERWKNHEKRSEDFKVFFKDLIEAKFRGLPCKARINETDRQFRLIWCFITIIIVAVIGVSIKSLWAG